MAAVSMSVAAREFATMSDLEMVDDQCSLSDSQETNGEVTRRGVHWRKVLAGGLVLAGAAAVWTAARRAGLGMMATTQDSLETGVAVQYQGPDSWLYTGVYDIPVRQVPEKPIPGAPRLDLYDGNPCYSDEELLSGLCYKKCSLLTADEYPVRGTAFSCCRAHPCTLTNQKVEVKLCSGFNVGGDMLAPGSCPHEPGACLENEELFLGLCYKKCSLLTDNTHPHRTAASTCCRESSTFECLKYGNIKSSVDYNVGGGTGDNDDRTPRVPHLPMPPLAELSKKTN